MQQIDALRAQFPDTAKDIRLNLQTVLKADKLSQPQVWAVALASACYLREPDLIDAITADAKADDIDPAYLQDARAAAALMAMNTIFYRFRHMVGREAYANRPARLRMQRMATPATSKGDFELMALACAALAGCEMCIKAHENSILKEGLTEDQVQDVVRIAATIHGAVVAGYCTAE